MSLGSVQESLSQDEQHHIYDGRQEHQHIYDGPSFDVGQTVDEQIVERRTERRDKAVYEIKAP